MKFLWKSRARCNSFAWCHIPDLLCAFAVLVCHASVNPFAKMGVTDRWPHSLIAQKLASTGHIVHNGWATPILGWELYLGIAFITLVGFSLTAIRICTL